MSREDTHTRPACPTCGSFNIYGQTTVTWDADGGWIASGAGCDEGGCDDCKATDITFKWVTVDDNDKPVRDPEASREEQHGRYIDSGPGAWDDTGRENFDQPDPADHD